VFFNRGFAEPQGSRVAARGSAKADGNSLGRNSFVIETRYTFGSLHRVPGATQTFAEGSAAAKMLKNTAIDIALFV